ATPAFRINVGFVVKPLISGLRYRESIALLSAPSAKSLTLRSDGFILASSVDLPDNPLRRFTKRGYPRRRRPRGLALPIAKLDKHRSYTRVQPPVDIPPRGAD